MAFIPVENTASVRMVYTHLGEVAMNTFHVHSTAGWNENKLDELADTFLDWHDVRLQPLQGANTVLLRVETRDLTEENGMGITKDCITGCVGLVNQAGAPGNVTVAVSWTTGFVGRSRRGRTFHIGLTDDQTSGNQVLEAIRVSLEAAYFDLISDVATADPDWRLVVVSRFEDGAPRSAGLVTEIRNATVDPNLDSMRTRLAGRGN
jgi:hypothetical protein